MPSERAENPALLKSEIDLEARIIRLRCGKRRSTDRNIRVRLVPIPWELLEPLHDQMDSTPGKHVFPPMCNVLRDFNAILERAGISKVDDIGRRVVPHSLRHPCATAIAPQVGNNPLILQKVRGHGSTKTTERYVHGVAPSDPLVVSLGSETDEKTAQGGATGRCQIRDLPLRKSG